MTDQEFKESIASSIEKLAAETRETDRVVKELSKNIGDVNNDRKETEKILKELSKNLGGIGNSNGDAAEEFFYNSLKKTMTFAGIHFDMISNDFKAKRNLPGQKAVEDQFDVVMYNGNTIAIIEVKYKAEKDYPKTMFEKKASNFRILYPYYSKHKIYLGLASMIFNKKVVEEAQKYGIVLLKQAGDVIESHTDQVRTY